MASARDRPLMDGTWRISGPPLSTMRTVLPRATSSPGSGVCISTRPRGMRGLAIGWPRCTFSPMRLTARSAWPRDCPVRSGTVTIGERPKPGKNSSVTTTYPATKHPAPAMSTHLSSRRSSK